MKKIEIDPQRFIRSDISIIQAVESIEPITIDQKGDGKIV
jgi:hypothetical protein